MNVKDLVGSGEKIGLVALPFLLAGVALNLAFPAMFSVGGPPGWLRGISIAVLVVGVIVWAWSAGLILTRVPRNQLITSGPFAVVRHPLYTAVALLVLPWIGFLLDTWLGVVIGLVVYVASRVFSPREEERLSRAFGQAWEAYRAGVMLPWL
jgi:protein-S-isoprenylcysteine O-methyltransferase Ste14